MTSAELTRLRTIFESIDFRTAAFDYYSKETYRVNDVVLYMSGGSAQTTVCDSHIATFIGVIKHINAPLGDARYGVSWTNSGRSVVSAGTFPHAHHFLRLLHRGFITMDELLETYDIS